MDPAGADPCRQRPARLARRSGSPRAAAPIGRTGAIDFRGAGVSARLWPARRCDVTGTATRAAVAARARPSPGFGIGLSDVSADVRAAAGGWAVTPTGESAYGPFSADVIILSGRGPMTIDINRLPFAGIDFAGRSCGPRPGPFAGTLTMTGQGLSGTRPARRGRAATSGSTSTPTANGARTPGDNADHRPARLRPGDDHPLPRTPHDRVGDAQLAGARQRRLFIVQRARVRADLQGGTGTAQLFAEGTQRRAVPGRRQRRARRPS